MGDRDRDYYRDEDRRYESFRDDLKFRREARERAFEIGVEAARRGNTAYALHMFDAPPGLIEEVLSPPAPEAPAPGSGPDEVGRLLDLALEQGRLGRYREVVETCTRALRLDPENAMAYRLRGGARYDLEQYKAAVRDLNRAIAREPDRGHLTRALAHERLGNDAKAIADFSEVIRSDPTHAVAHGLRGDCRRRIGDVAGARSDYERAIELFGAQGKPDHAQDASRRLALLAG